MANHPTDIYSKVYCDKSTTSHQVLDTSGTPTCTDNKVSSILKGVIIYIIINHINYHQSNTDCLYTHDISHHRSNEHVTDKENLISGKSSTNVSHSYDHIYNIIINTIILLKLSLMRQLSIYQIDNYPALKETH